MWYNFQQFFNCLKNHRDFFIAINDYMYMEVFTYAIFFKKKLA